MMVPGWVCHSGAVFLYLFQHGWSFALRSTDEKDNTTVIDDCKEIDYTSPGAQKEEGLKNCPENEHYFILVAGVFIAGLVVSYVFTKLIVKCSQIGVKAAPKKGAKPEKKEKKADVPGPRPDIPGVPANGGVKA